MSQLTQLERLNQLRARFHEVFPDLARTKDEMRRLLKEADDSPDGSVKKLSRNNLDEVCKGAEHLLLALLFPS